MDENRFERDGAGPPDDLSPALRRAVDGVLRDPPPDDVTSRALAAARQLGMQHPEAAISALRRRRVVWQVLAVAASIGLVAALVWWRWGGPPDGQVVVQPPLSPIGAGNVQPIPQGPESPRGDREPSLWAYRQAAGQSSEALDAMLDRDARRLLRPEPRPIHAGASLASIRQTL